MLKTELYPIFKRLALIGLRSTGGLPLLTPWSGIGHIFTLHRIIEKPQDLSIFNSILEISIPTLEKHFKYLRRKGFNFISLDELPFFLKQANTKHRFVIFTFDDGYLDNYTLALPLFQQYNIPFTVYIANGFPDAEIIVWWYLLENMLKENSKIQFEHNDRQYILKVERETEKSYAFEHIRSLIISTPKNDQPQLLKNIFKTYISDLYAKTNEMSVTWSQVEAMSQSPLVTIGAHTMHHYALKLLKQNEAVYEIAESKGRIETHIHKKVEHFAYPFGSSVEVSQREIDIVKEIGFKTAASTLVGNIYPGHQDLLFSLPRVFLSERVNKFALNVRLNGVYPVLTNFGQKITTF